EAGPRQRAGGAGGGRQTAHVAAVAQREDPPRPSRRAGGVRRVRAGVGGGGLFVGLEVVMGEGEDEATAYDRVATLAAALELRPQDRIATSYSNLIEAARRAVFCGLRAPGRPVHSARG